MTGTYNRHELLLGAIENVRQQTYRPLEHVIVADGPDERLDEILLEEYVDNLNTPEPWRVDMRTYSLGFHSSSVLTNSISAAPFMVAQLMARGDYQMWLADDERMLVPDHIETLVKLLDEYDADFAYPKVEMTWPDSDRKVIIGHNPPRNGDVTHMLYRRDMLDHGALFRTHVGSGTDWDAFARMMAARPNGRPSRWVFNPHVTLTHVVNKVVVMGVLAGALGWGWL